MVNWISFSIKIEIAIKILTTHHHLILGIFEAIENNQCEKLRELLKDGSSFVNSLNSDGFYPLDEAILLEQSPMIKLLLLHDAKTTITSNNIEMRLTTLLNDAEQKLCQCAASISSSSGQTGLLTVIMPTILVSILSLTDFICMLL